MLGVGAVRPDGQLGGASRSAPGRRRLARCERGRSPSARRGRSSCRCPGSGRSGSGRCCGRFGTRDRDPGTAIRPGGAAALVAAERQPTAARRSDRAVAQAIVAARRGAGTVLAGSSATGVDILTTRGPAYPRRLLGDRDAAARPVRPGRRRRALGERMRWRSSEPAGRPKPAGYRLADRGGAWRRPGRSSCPVSRSGSTGPRQAAARRRTATVAVLGSGHARSCTRGRTRSSPSDRRRRRCGRLGARPRHPAEPASTFPRRNRLISGLIGRDVVVEAGEKSGALITAGWALEQGRECSSCPARSGEPRSAGCLLWLRSTRCRPGSSPGIRS